MSRYASELCVLLVDNLYGELTSRIFQVILREGRLSIPALIHHTGLTPRLVKHGIAVLLQQQLVFWHTSAEDATVYEANTTAAYNLVRAGKYVQIAEEQLGHFAGAVISNLLLLGHARVGDLVQAYGTRSKDKPPLSNGSGSVTDDNVESDVTPKSVHITLHDLLQAGLVSLVNESHFRSDADNRIEAGKVVPAAEYFKNKTKRENEEQREMAILQKLEEWKYPTAPEEEEVEIVNRGKKRRLEDPKESETIKRQRLYLPLVDKVASTAGTAGALRIGHTGALNNDHILRINHDKFAVIMRNRSLVALAEQSICKTTAKVYAEVLRRLESKVRNCKEETGAPDFGDGPELHALPQVSTDDIVAALRHSTDLANAFGNVDASRVNLRQSDHPKRRRRREESDSEDEVMKDGNASRGEEEDEDDSDSEALLTSASSESEEEKGEAEYDPSSSTKTRAKAPENPQLNTIRDHLLLLAQHPYQFLHHFPETPILPEKWTVYFAPLMAHLTHHTLLRTITSRYGLRAARLTRLLSEKGKVDEKNLCSLSLLNQKTMRSYLTALHQAGMIQLQEVPRDNSRNPQRTLYLWFFDIERCKAKMLQETYKSMARCLQRVQVEGDKVKSTVEKASRSDVIGREEEFLGVQEREALRKWREMEDKIWGEVARLDDMVAIMRDF
ncbi:hypothetical protein N7G274_005465 [Stereocaulon virgatum]|uniref:DNA-directed RNA polymerase III subunit RPC3 n=1 Tax=Stereocaulon virgatum TaxID=373712 RepID=A0ABR4A8D7_9LECA